jgi:CheY-like chemotaxis protein
VAEEVEVLLVDDSASDVELTIMALREHALSHRIHVAEDGEQALDFIFCRGPYAGRSFAHPPRVVLLDLKMPKVDGVSVLRAIRGDERTRAIPVVILTSSNEQRDLVESYRLNANAYVRKPIDFEKYQRVVEQLGTFWLKVNELPPQEAFKARG